ncbi:isochorismatase family cysteine hydrolase [Variovorax sp. J22R133]|uniref:cysteine hydrolase family protein n=1 Tax=Variovorax brevis TaxID=3053503 RepID=UPI002576C476|nr:isochorismatase family cysteine hydrolase [Variovorax sp. J22R133]MDM0117387.1 isochorismatase family cysteine hydrolase [Variovorax sp. J22R133]
MTRKSAALRTTSDTTIGTAPIAKASTQIRTNTPAKPAAPEAKAPARFGPAAHNAWSLEGDTVSLMRTPKRPKPVHIPALPQSIEFDLARTALVVIDMQNDFCHPEGWFAQKGIDIKPCRKPIPTIAGLLPTWRKAGGTVVWCNWGIRADRRNLSPTVQFKGKRSADGVGYAEHSAIDHGPSLVQGSWGAQVIDELAVAPTDITVHKHRLSGFWDNELDTLLRQQGITTLLFAGINTDRCVFSTLQDANFLGYDCVLLEDACSTPSPAFVTKGVLFIVQQLHGFVAKAADVRSSLAKPVRANTIDAP